jgi:AcrR family transcriptional regulator
VVLAGVLQAVVSPVALSYGEAMPASPRKPKMTPSAKRAPRSSEPALGSAVRNELLAGAARVFAGKGAADATVEDILVEAAISRRTFYRFFNGKEEILDALHELATQLFLQAMREAFGRDGALLEKIERCVDVFLGFGRSQGALMLVLSGEAQRPDSQLAPRRRAVFEALGAMFDDEILAQQKRRVDPIVTRSLLGALEAANRMLLEKGPLDAADAARAKRAMMRIMGATLAGAKDVVPALPLDPKARSGQAEE